MTGNTKITTLKRLVIAELAPMEIVKRLLESYMHVQGPVI